MRTKFLCGLLLATLSAAALAAGQGKAEGRLQITTLSNQPHLLSGGDALVRVDVPPAVALDNVQVTLNGTDITAAFRQNAGAHALEGVVTGLQLGGNRLTATTEGPGRSRRSTTLELTNYPAKGPIVSGPHLQPFICQTETFRLPDGSFLGAPIDEDCSVATRVDYVYRSTAGGPLLPLPSTSSLPADVATTTTLDGVTVPFVVRLETGTMNRGIYQNAILHDPTSEPAPSPFAPPKGWNQRLLALHGSGCPGGWYIQGGAQGGNILDVVRLGEGYALFINTLNHPSNSCNAFLAGETTMMGKEHFIETFGRPAFTVSTGCSGGAYTSLQVADAFPDLFDGVLIQCTYPDALSIALSAMDSRLLSNYYLNGNPGSFSETQIVAVSGHKHARAWYDLAVQMGRTDPVPGRADPIPPSPLFGGYNSAVWNAAVPTALRYHPVDNPGGARPTVFDVARNVYGVDSATGFARRPFDNVGVQYGLEALNAGIIGKHQFLDLNERIGGFDQDSSFVPNRTAGDVGAIRRAHQSGVTLGGSGGLASIPVFDTSLIYDDDQIYHYQWFHFAARERMKSWNGHTKNHVMWRGGAPITALFGIPHPYGLQLNAFVAARSWEVFIDWVEAYKADASNAPQLVKVLRHKPAAAVDGCFTQSATPEFIAEPQTLSSEPDSQCNALWPSWSFPRLQAGGPLHANTLKCRLKALDPRDYQVSFSADEWARLEAAFPQGVCDWSRRGEGEVPVMPGASFGPSPANQVFEVQTGG